MKEFILSDGKFLVGIQQLLNADWLTLVMKAITMFGEYGLFWIALCILLIAIPKTRRLGIICAATLAAAFVCCNLILKPLVDRPRPWEIFPEVEPLLPDPGDASFPSGHAFNSIAPALAMFLATRPGIAHITDSETGKVRTVRSYEYTPSLGWRGAGADPRIMHRISVAAVILAVLIGVSRLYLGMHFPSDVIGGLLLGGAVAVIIHTVIIKIEERRGIIGAEKV